MSNSSLVVYKKMSPNYTKMFKKKNTDIVIHHMAGKLSIETCGNVFARTSTEASSNYGIGNDGRIGLYVDESNRSWATSNAALDKRAVTIEVANSEIGGDWPVSDKAMDSLIELCVDICKRNKIKKLNYTGDKTGNLHMHCWYAATACPGPYLKSKFSYIAKEVNKRLETEVASADKFNEKYAGTYKTISALNLRADAGTANEKLVTMPKNTKVQCFGYYSLSKTRAKWLYVQTTVDGVKYTGFCSKSYLKKA